MPRPNNRLTDTFCKKSKLKRGTYADGGGLYLQVSKSGTKAWILRYMMSGVAHNMGLGDFERVTLKEARSKAMAAHSLIVDGIDPIEERKARKQALAAEKAKALTFKECAERYIAAHEASWRNEKHREQWKSTLARYAYPIIGGLSVSAIDTALVVKVIEALWATKPETATRLRGRVESVLNWATVRGFRAGDNPARWRGHLDKLLPARGKVKPVKHHAALPYAEIPTFMADLRSRDGISARALELTILTAGRTGEVIGARWSEFDIKAKVWTIPAERMKGGREHRVPLNDRAVAILTALPREGDGDGFVFIGARADRPLSNMAMLELMRGLRPGYVPHGFRSTFRDWAAETTNYQNHIVEMALAHVVGDRVEAAYRRGDLFEKRRRLMGDWARYCSRQASPDAEVVLFEPQGGRK